MTKLSLPLREWFALKIEVLLAPDNIIYIIAVIFIMAFLWRLSKRRK